MSDFRNAGRDPRVLRVIDEARGKRVIHLGCADAPFTRERLANGTLLHLKLLDVAAELIGVDVDVESMSMIQEHSPSAQFATPDAAPSFDQMTPDLVVAGEVIEHVTDFVSFGALLRRVCGPGTEVIVTTPNAYSLKAVLRALVGTEQQHPDHKCLFSNATLIAMMRDLGFESTSVSYYNNPPRRLIAAPVGYSLNILLRIMPRASDGLYFKFKKLL